MDSKTESATALNSRWAENMTYTVSVPELTVADYTRWKQDLVSVEPPQVLSRFLGDAYRQWCMHSQVGFALSLSHFQAKWMAEEGRFTAEFASKVARFETGLAILEPLLSGLAAYAQFDHWPASDAVLPFPTLRMVAYFCADDETDDFMLDRHLYDARVFSQEALDAKIALLSGPFDCTVDTGLTGYLAVRALPRHLDKAGLQYAKLPNFYLQLLREMIFGNPYLVQALLTDHPGVESAVLNVVNVVETQLGELQNLSKERESNFARAKIAQLQKDELHVCDPFHEIPGLFPGTGRIMSDVRRQAMGARRKRDWSSFDLVAFPENPPFILELAADDIVGETFDAAFVYITQKNWRMADPAGYNLVRRGLTETRQSNFEIAHQKSSVDLEGWLQEGCGQYANKLYRPLALSLFPEEKRAAATTAMSQTGLLGLGMSPEALETLVLLSFCSPNATREHTQKVLEEAPLSLEEAIGEWDRVEAEYGIKLHQKTKQSHEALI